MIKLTGTVGHRGDRPLKPFVIIDESEDWLTPRRARHFAMRLLKAADQAEDEYKKWKKENKGAKRNVGG